MKGLFRILEIRDFRNLWVGQAISQFGDALYFLIFMFMVQRLTGDARMVGAVSAIQALPYLLLGPYAGAIADRIDRRRIMLAADMFSTGLLIVLGIAFWINPNLNIWVIIGSAGLLSCINTFFGPAKGAAIPRLVPLERLMEANALSATAQNLMPLIGLALSALVLGQLESRFPNLFFESAILVNAATFLASAAFIRRLPPVVPEKQDHEKHPMRDAIDGLHWVWKHQVIRAAFFLSLGLNLFISPFMLVYVYVNAAWFGGQYWTLALFESCFVGAMLLASLLLPRFRITKPGLAFCLGVIACGVFVSFMGLFRPFPIFILWNIACGLVLPFAQIPLQTYFQQAVPDEFRGRVQSLMVLASMAVIPLSNAIAAFVINSIGAANMYIVMGAGFALCGAAGLVNTSLRRSEVKVGPVLEA